MVDSVHWPFHVSIEVLFGVPKSCFEIIHAQRTLKRIGMFVDRVLIEVSGGDGGNGCLSFRREKYVPLGGPDGGNGGDGGSVVLVVEQGVNSLVALAHRKHWRADSGHAGKGANRHGRSAPDLRIPVPPGTLIIDAKNDFIIKDLTVPGEELIIARGGKGGYGNAHFKSSTNQAPRQTTPGESGESRRVILELKVIADVGLIGKPNAGKSTLLSRLSKARPEVADYPFTTKFPNLGMAQVHRDRAIVLADIPGLIEGAHRGVGLGHDFLKHIERCGVLVHLVEPAPQDGSNPIDNYVAIRHELLEYNPNLAQRPEIVVISKCELPGAQDMREQLAAMIGRDVLMISSATGEGLAELLRTMVSVLDADTVARA